MYKYAHIKYNYHMEVSRAHLLACSKRPFYHTYSNPEIYLFKSYMPYN